MPTITLGVVMDPIHTLHYHKDSTLAMLWEAQARNWIIYYFEPTQLFLRDGVVFGQARRLQVFRDEKKWFQLDETITMPLTDLHVILMRKDPPFNQAYIYTTYLLEYAERAGVLVVNRPQALRDCNEKLFINYFPECIPPTLVTSSAEALRNFWQEQQDIVCKPLDGMGGTSVFRLRKEDANANVVFDLLTQHGTMPTMAQRFISAIKQGDKRILLINGEPITHALARVPQGQEWRGNLAVGAKGKVQPLTERDRFICAQIGPVLRQRGLYFVGIDVIGDYLTEINVTSPTGIRELDLGLESNISALLLDYIERQLSAHPSAARGVIE
ncbi:MAG TPA: glutathione synthase [Gammaproteobacteria bacterium]|jgi:glutathione synthase|nr:glutathione synthase [Gammaproteobacteria bacterium]